ncbi:MAG: tryptophan halogenase family protein [Thalassotalea sp.]
MDTKNSAKLTQRIVILGGGTAGWMTAAALAKLIPQSQFSITLVESDQIATVGVGEATIPSIRAFNQRLGINEVEFMQATKATFKAGIEFQDWAEIGDRYLHPFGAFGEKINGIAFYQYWLKNHMAGGNSPLGDYSLAVKACQAGKFQQPSSDPDLLTSTYSYAYHFDASLYAKYLRKFSEKLGVNRIEGKVERATLDERGHITSLVLATTQVIEGDFFIDCSGFRAQLIGQTLNAEFEDWSAWLPCNKAVAIASEHSFEADHKLNPAPYTKSMAKAAGWQWQIPLQHRIGNGYVYCDKYINQEQALTTLLANLPGQAVSEPKFLAFTTGCRKQAWVKNCLAIGLASGFLEPLESTSIYLIEAAIIKFIELLPQATRQLEYEPQRLAAELEIKAQAYNRSLAIEMTRIRDFLILHYHANQRTDSEFWRDVRAMAIPDSLKERMTMFQETSHIQTYKTGIFFESSWTAVYFGQKFFPKRYDARVDLFPASTYQDQLEKTRNQVLNTVNSMPSHQDFLLSAGCIFDHEKAAQSLTSAKFIVQQ